MSALAEVITMDSWRQRGGVAASAPVERKTHRRLTPDAKTRLKADLRALPVCTKAAYRDLAEQYDVSERTVQNVLADLRAGKDADQPAPPRVCHVLPSNVADVVAERGSMKQAWRVFQAQGQFSGGYVTFTRQMKHRFGSNVARGLARGPGAMGKHVYLEVPTCSFMRRYTIDLFSLRMAVVNDRGVTVHPTGMFLREDHTDVIVAAYVFDSDQVTAAMVANLLGGAFNGRSYEVDGSAVRLGGIPREVLCDNGGQFAAEELRTALAPLGVAVANINSYASNENGKHERKHGTVRSQLLQSLPGSNDGARDRRGELMDTRELLSLGQVRELVARWVWWYDNEPQSRDGMSPLDRWQAAETAAPVRFASPSEVAHLTLLHHRTCKRYPLGVRLLNRHFGFPDLSRHPSKSFAVGVWLDDSDHVELFDATGRTWLGRATDSTARTAAEEQAILDHRARETGQVVAAHKRARGRDPLDRPELPPLPRTADAPAETTSAPVVRATSLADALEKNAGENR